MFAVRVATIHPLLSHLTIGGLPLILIAYAMAWRRRSESWSFVGDVALIVTALATIGTLAFGLVSDHVVSWPGGLETWRALHLAGGISTTVLLLAIAAWRFSTRRSHPVASPFVLVASLVAATAAGFTGGIGGEILVFHSGMAVRAAGDGALSPPIIASDPKDFLGAMREVRAAWGGIVSELSSMLVQHPSDESFARIEHDAERMRKYAGVMGDRVHGTDKTSAMLVSMSQTLAGDAETISDAAKKKSLQDLSSAVGDASGHCADCHEETRWKKP